MPPTKQNLWVRAASHAAALIPLLLMGINALCANLGANPIQKIEQRTGDAALILLLGSLLISPLVRWTGAQWIKKFKRRWGLYAFFYASLHLIIFVGVDFGLDLRRLMQEVVEKRFILVGLAAFLILLAMTITSFGRWKQRLGKNWKRLHRLVYVANILVVLHFLWVSKADALRLQGDLRKPILAGVIVLILLGLRLPVFKRKTHSIDLKLEKDQNRV